MRGKLGLVAAGALALAVPAAAADNWVRVSAPDGSFSVETPCSEAELAFGKTAPDNLLKGLPLTVEHRVYCFKSADFILGAGAFDVPELPWGTATLFDMISTLVANTKDVMGAP